MAVEGVIEALLMSQLLRELVNLPSGISATSKMMLTPQEKSEGEERGGKEEKTREEKKAEDEELAKIKETYRIKTEQFLMSSESLFFL